MSVPATKIQTLPVGRLCDEIDDKVRTFLDRPIKAERRYPWIDAPHRKVRRGDRNVSVAAIIAVAVNTDIVKNATK